MTKKDYQKIASIIKDRVGLQRTDWYTEMFMLASDIARMLQEDNPRFNREKFLITCGVISGAK
jgi:hypothetical protein